MRFELVKLSFNGLTRRHEEWFPAITIHEFIEINAMQLQFTKMQGLGNDFIVIDGVNQQLDINSEQARRLANRKHGVGCDQILMVEKSQQPGVDFKYRILNADGGEVEQCGNGARCFAVFVRDRGLTEKTSIRVQTKNSLMTLNVESDTEVTVDMGVPEFEPENIPFIANEQSDSYQLNVNGSSLEVAVLSIGNPHVVQIVDDVDTAPVAEIGPLIESHARFPNRVNAGFMQIINENQIKLRVYERGVGETLACGSGACAAMVAGRNWGLLNKKVDVILRGGPLMVTWLGPGESVLMTGTATKVFDGEIDLDKL